MIEYILPIILAVIGSGIIQTIITTVSNHKGQTKKALEGIDNRLCAIEEKMEEEKVKNCRTRILRFADEIAENKKHSKEHFSDIFESINTYNAYCHEHPTFKNAQTVDAQEVINETYKSCIKNHSFLRGDK